jgi:hypothetical protein
MLYIALLVLLMRTQEKLSILKILEKPIGFTDGNYFHSSNGMEVEGIRRSSINGARTRL